MAVDVVMPQMGESIFEGTITKWLKKPGDKVERDEPLFEISTDKVDAEIPAPAAGVLREIKIAEGQTVPVKTVVAVIDAAGAASAVSDASAPVPRPSRIGQRAAARGRPKARARKRRRGNFRAGLCCCGIYCGTSPRPQAGTEKRFAARLWCGAWRARKTSIWPRCAAPEPADASARTISWPPSPRASRLRVKRTRPPLALAPHALLETAVPRERIYFGHYQVQPMSVMRQRIAEHMVLSKRVSPHVYSIDEADMTHVAQLRAAAKSEFEKRNETKLTFMPFFVRACAEALRAFPLVNASVDGANVVLHGEINIGIAVALEAGLIVPVVKDAGEKKFLALQRAINDLAERARAKKLKPEEVQESTFSITNPGIFGGLLGLPVINQPNAAILAIGAIQKRPVVVDDAIAIRSMVYLVLSYDHRIVDGAIAHQFMGQVKRRLETWDEEIL